MDAGAWEVGAEGLGDPLDEQEARSMAPAKRAGIMARGLVGRFNADSSYRVFDQRAAGLFHPLTITCGPLTNP